MDVYLNGEYNGLYLLAEKIEINSERLDLNVAVGDFLCTIDFSVRTELLENPFSTEAGRTIAICEPKKLTDEGKKRIQNLVNEQERLILSQEDLTKSELVDVDSWVRKYLIDEITANIDADLSSSYFYFSDGIFYAGPVWDYDMAFGCTIQNRYPKSFFAKNYVKYAPFYAVYYSALFDNPSFYNRMVEIFKIEFLPVLHQLIDCEVPKLANKIASAAEMNIIRYPVIGNDHPEDSPWDRYTNSPDDIIHYLKERTNFLTSALIDKVSYCTLQFEHPSGGHFWTVSVPYGSVINETDIILEPLFKEIEDITWIVRGSEEIFDPTKPVIKDLVLWRKYE